MVCEHGLGSEEEPMPVNPSGLFAWPQRRCSGKHCCCTRVCVCALKV